MTHPKQQPRMPRDIWYEGEHIAHIRRLDGDTLLVQCGSRWCSWDAPTTGLGESITEAHNHRRREHEAYGIAYVCGCTKPGEDTLKDWVSRGVAVYCDWCVKPMGVRIREAAELDGPLLCEICETEEAGGVA